MSAQRASHQNWRRWGLRPWTLRSFKSYSNPVVESDKCLWKHHFGSLLSDAGMQMDEIADHFP
jgi:hypothetical protein